MPGSMFRLMVSKDGKKQQFVEENRRNTYRPHSVSANGTGSIQAMIGGEPPQLIPVGHQVDFPFARSLTRFAPDLGPAVWKIAAEKIRKALPAGVPFGPGWVVEREVPAGGNFMSPLGKPQSLLQTTKVIRTGGSEIDKDISLKGNMSGAEVSVGFQQLRSKSVLPVNLNSTSENVTPIPALLPPHERSMALQQGPLQHDRSGALQHLNRQNETEASLSSPPVVNFGETLQSKQNVLLHGNRPVAWSANRQPDQVLTASQPPSSCREKYPGEKLREENEMNEADKSKLASRVTPGVGAGPSILKQGSNVGGSHAVRQSHAMNSEDSFLFDRNASSAGIVNNQISDQKSSATHLVARSRDNVNVHGWLQTQQSDLSQLVGSIGVKMPSQLPGNAVHTQSMASLQYAQSQDLQSGVPESQQPGIQAGLASLHIKQKLPPNIPQFLQQQLTPEVYSFLQQQQMRLHLQGNLSSAASHHGNRQGNSKPAALHQGGSSMDLGDPNLPRHSHFAAQLESGMPQSQNQVWQYHPSQFLLQQGSSLPLSAAPDLNVSLPPTKSHSDQSNGNELQPDLALQL